MPHFKKNSRKQKYFLRTAAQRRKIWSQVSRRNSWRNQGYLIWKENAFNSNYMMVLFKYEGSHAAEGFFWMASKDWIRPSGWGNVIKSHKNFVMVVSQVGQEVGVPAEAGEILIRIYIRVPAQCLRQTTLRVHPILRWSQWYSLQYGPGRKNKDQGGSADRVGTWVCEAEVKDLRFPNLAVGSHP